MELLSHYGPKIFILFLMMCRVNVLFVPTGSSKPGPGPSGYTAAVIISRHNCVNSALSHLLPVARSNGLVTVWKLL